MDIERLREKKKNYDKAVLKLKEALNEDISNPLIYDGVIQRFEFTYELAWKLMKVYLEYEGIAVGNSPRKIFKEAFVAGLILNGEVWIDMINARNLSAHTYNEQTAREIYYKVKEEYYDTFVAFANKIGEIIK